MERPRSRDYTRPASSDGGGKGHTRNASTTSTKAGVRSSVSPVVSLFVTNLRLLNLDLLPDWPGITISSFGNQDARARMRCTEFALFHLFKLYDPATTADKLQPFYPPLEPLQSINLRAALYRCLNELKKNGVLGKETVLRKTMLDDCQGEKFWELCLAFSATLLRKVTLEKKSRYGRSVAERIGTAQSLNADERASMLPLALAHKASLSKVLHEKQRKREAFSRLSDILMEKESELARRKVQAIEMARASPSEVQLDRLSTVGQTLDKRWVGSKALRNALADGDVSREGNDVLTRPLDQLASRPSDAMQPLGVIEGIENTANKQAQRVRKWQSMYQDLQASKPVSQQSTKSERDRGPLRFDKHRNLTVRDTSPPTSPQQRQTTETSGSVRRYDDILTTMREELRRNKRAMAPQAPASVVSRHRQTPRQPSITIDTSVGARDPHRRTSSQTAVPMRPSMNRRASSRSKSYQQPKVESQRQFIRLKSELFSPLKPSMADRRHSTSPMSASPLAVSPIDEGDSPAATPGPYPVKRSSKVDSGIGLGIAPIRRSGTDEEMHELDSTLPTQHDNEEAHTATVPNRGRELSVSTLPVPHEDKTQHKASFGHQSLAERTRMSMAFKSPDQSLTKSTILPDPPASAPPATVQKDAITTPPMEQEELPSNRRTTLVDRTRASISLAPQAQPKITHKRSRTSIYRVNQFDTPRGAKPRSSTLGGRRDSTPQEELFSPDAEYDSVFKPRPKVAMSPTLSPFVDGNSLDELGMGSPLVGGGQRRNGA